MDYIPKTIVLEGIHDTKIKQRLKNILDVLGWDTGEYIIQIYYEIMNDGEKTKGQIIMDLNIDADNNDYLIERLLNMYNVRGRARWYSKLKQRNIDETYEESMRKKKILGDHILNYTKIEKMFMGQPKRCTIIFKLKNEQHYYNMDDILNPTNDEKMTKK